MWYTKDVPPEQRCNGFFVSNRIPVDRQSPVSERQQRKPLHVFLAEHLRDRALLFCDRGRLVATKRCSRCGQAKDTGEFGFHKRSSDGLRWECKACRKEWYLQHAEELSAKQKEHYREHADEIKAKTQAYRERNPEKTAQANRSWAARNADKVKLYMVDWRKRNVGKMQVWSREYREKNADKIRARERGYYKANPQKERQKKHTRRARVRDANGQFTAAEWEALKAQHHHTCLRCGRREPEITLTPDHVIALANGGTNDIGNIQPLCQRCNSAKGTRTYDYR